MRRFVSVVTLSFVSSLLLAQSPEPAEILRRAALFGQFTSLEASLTMEIHERRGSKDRGLTAYVVREEDRARALVQITSPAFLGNMKFLSVSDGPETSQWLATSRGVRRVAGSSRNDRLFDSDFTVEDLSDYQPDDFDLTLMGSETVDGVETHLLEAVPRDAETDYAKRVMNISKETGLLARARFYDDDGELVREFELIEHMELDGVPFPRVAKMTTVSRNTHTLLTVEEARVGHTIPERLFNRGNL